MTENTTHWRSPHGRKLPSPDVRTLLMGILNVTPDSFSDGGRYDSVRQAVRQVERMIVAGADVIDVGGESTRPGAAPVSASEEAGRVLPIVEAIRAEFSQVAISIDTYKAEIAAAAIEAGADIINDIWGARHGIDPITQQQALQSLRLGEPQELLPVSPMAQCAARLGCPLILMHNRALPQYRDFWKDTLDDLRLSIALAQAAGLPADQLWLDPGFGFGKTPAHNLEVLRELDRICGLGFPVLLGTSRKSTIGFVLDKPVEEREDGTHATLVWGIAKGCRMVRVHDVARARDAVRMADAIRAGLGFERTRPAVPSV